MLQADLFLDAIFLLINDNSERYQKLVTELIAIYESESQIKERDDAELIRFYIDILKSLIEDNVDRDDPDTLTRIIIKYKTNPGLERYQDVIESLSQAFSSRKTENADTTSKKFGSIVKAIKSFIIRNRIDKGTRKIFATLQSSSGVDAGYQISSLEDARDTMKQLLEATQYEEGDDVYDGPQPLGYIAFHERDTIKAALKKRNARDCSGVIKSGLQGMNRGLGEAGGLIPGESICHCAMSHHGKSLSIVSWAIWTVLYNPIQVDDGRIPLVLLTSLENEEYRNMMDIFKRRYRQVEGKHPRGMSDEAIEDWIVNYFGQYGTKLVIERFADGYNIKVHRARLKYWQSLGYKIVMDAIDYLSNMELGNGTDTRASRGSRDEGLRELSYHLVNDARIGGWALATGHQLNRGAEIVAEGNLYPAKKFNMSHLQDSSSIFREFDIICFQHKLIIPSSGLSFMSYFIGKHRHVEDTPEAHKSFCYQFLPDGVGIKDDLGHAPAFVTDPYTFEFDPNAILDGTSGDPDKQLNMTALDAF